MTPRENTDRRQEVLKPQEEFKQGVLGSDFDFRFTALAFAAWRMFRLRCGDKIIIELEKAREFHMFVTCVMQRTRTVPLAYCRKLMLSFFGDEQTRLSF